MTPLVLAFALTMGLSPPAGMVTYDPAVLTVYPLNIYTDLAAELRAGPFFLGGEMRAEESPLSPTEWLPTLQGYGISAGIRVGGIEVGYAHACQHPVVVFAPLLSPVIHWEGAWDTVYVSFSGSSKL